MRYILKHAFSQATTGHFSVEPEQELPLETCLEHLARFPLDLFLHRHILDRLENTETKDLEHLAENYGPKLLSCLAAETGRKDAFGFSPEEVRGLSPLGELDVPAEPAWWIRSMQANVTGLSPLPAFGELPPAAAGKDPAQTALFDLHLPGPGTGRTELPPSREVAETAAFRLQGLGVLCGQEMRHTNSPAPVGLVRNWFFQRQTQSNGLNFSLHGTQTSYGRGPDLDSARAGLLMEIVERFCAFATVRGDRIPDLSGANRITRAKYSEITKDFHCLNPKELLPDYPYQDEELAWMPAEELTFKGAREILVPVQIVFLFSNLGEKSLFAAPSSTGLAAGTNIKQARLGALMEVLERDALGLGLFQPENCFRLQEDGSPWGRMLAAAIPENTDVIFQDITPDLGIPCYKALVRDGQGDIHFGSGAALDSGRALWNALTEIPLPPGLTPAPVLTAPLEETGVQDLPDYSSGEISRDLETVCSLLIANGYRPIFAHLTRRDLGFPVVRAIVPGLEPSVDFDRYRRLTPRLKQAWEKTEERKLNRKPPGS